jgi:hypothetical protein
MPEAFARHLGDSPPTAQPLPAAKRSGLTRRLVTGGFLHLRLGRQLAPAAEHLHDPPAVTRHPSHGTRRQRVGLYLGHAFQSIKRSAFSAAAEAQNRSP